MRWLIRKPGAIAAAMVFWMGLSQAQQSDSVKKRARPPEFSADSIQGIFFTDLKDAVVGTRPAIGERSSSPTVGKPKRTDQADQQNRTGWSKRVSAVALEDEIKRTRLRFDAVVTTPSAFRSGGYQDARRLLTVMSTLFAVIHEYDGDVRWKKDAATARDVFSRSARNAQSGTVQVYNEIKQRKADLQDLMSGSGLNGRSTNSGNDWALIADRTPLMTYAEELLDELQEQTREADSIQSGADDVLRLSEMLGLLGVVLAQEGMDEADDPDYVDLCAAMSEASLSVRESIAQQDWSSVRGRVGKITQSCADCHEQYR